MYPLLTMQRLCLAFFLTLLCPVISQKPWPGAPVSLEPGLLQSSLRTWRGSGGLMEDFFTLFAVCKEPPYKVEESGYAGFIMLIEVYFKNKVRDWVGGGGKYL